MPLSCVFAADDDGYTPQYLTGHLNFFSGEGTDQAGSVDGIKAYLYFEGGTVDYNGYVSLSDHKIYSSNGSNNSKRVNKIVIIPSRSPYYLASGSRYGIFCKVQDSTYQRIKSFNFFTSDWASDYDKLESTATSCIIVPRSDLSLQGSFFQVDLTGYYALNTLSLSFFSLQLMPGLYAEGEGQAIVDKLEEGQQEAQQQHEETKGLLGSIIDGILSIPGKIIDLLSDLLKSLFVPDDTFIQNWVNDLQSWFEQKFGILALPFTFLTTLIGAFSSAGSGDVSLVFPGFEIVGHEVWADQTVDMASILQPFEVIVTAIRMALGVVLLGAFIHYLQALYDRVLGAGGDSG